MTDLMSVLGGILAMVFIVKLEKNKKSALFFGGASVLFLTVGVLFL